MINIFIMARKKVVGARMSLGQVITKLKKVEKTVKVLKPEIKFDDTPFTAVLVTNAGSTMYQLTNINEGDGPSDRDGDQINLHSYHLRLGLESKSAAFGGLARVIVFLHKGDATVAPPIADLFETYTANITAPMSMKKRNWQNTYKFLTDRVVRIPPNSQNGPVFLNIYREFKSVVKTTFDGALGTQKLSNQLYMFITWDQSAAGQELQVNGYTRLLFTDI